VQPDARAIIFDLDDTLYPIRRFLLSGYAAVAWHLEHMWAIDRHAAFSLLTQAFRSDERGYELQICQEHFGLPEAVIPGLVEVIRTHTPNLRLPRSSRDVLQRLRDGWRIAILTNGMPSIQTRKVEALGLADLVDTVVFASEFGSGAGKPDPEPFVETARRLDLPVTRSVFVGDDMVRDIAGASRVGMRTIHLRRGDEPSDTIPDATVDTLAEVPELAEYLLRGRSHG
jgi:putative hydrolase of the HAD superfamily